VRRIGVLTHGRSLHTETTFCGPARHRNVPPCRAASMSRERHWANNAKAPMTVSDLLGEDRHLFRTKVMWEMSVDRDDSEVRYEQVSRSIRTEQSA
jgi:hypothetical protein